MLISVQYIWHACFVVKLSDAVLIFDFWKIPEGAQLSMEDLLDGIDPSMPIYLFVSHAHKDHFNPCVFDWAATRDNIRLVVSKDVARFSRHRLNPASTYRGLKVPAERVAVARKGDVLSFPRVTVRAYGSTDAGNSYMVEAAGMRFFHAGDLNLWILAGMSEGERREARNRFLAVMEEIEAGEKRASADRPLPIEAMMWPVDRRIGDDFMEGALDAIGRLAPRRFLPMHLYPLEEVDRRRQLAGAYSLAEALPECSTTEVVILSSPGDMIAFAIPESVGK